MDLKHLRATAYRLLLDADRPLPTHLIARRLFGPRRHERPETQVVVRALLADDPRFLQTHDRRWAVRNAPALRRPLNEASFVVVDLETTGSLIGVDEIIEIGLVVIRDGAVCEQMSTLVRAGRPVPPWVENLTGIHDSDLSEAPTFQELAAGLSRILEGSVFVAHDVLFDLPFLRWEFASRGLKEPSVTGLCTLNLSRLLWPDLRSRTLAGLARHFRVPLDQPHRAGQDALATAGILCEALSEAHGTGLDRVGDLFQAPRSTGTTRRRRSGPRAARVAD